MWKNFLRLKNNYIAERYNEYSPIDLYNVSLIRHEISRGVPGDSPKSQRNLFHGVKIRTGQFTCFSDKKSKRWFRPNAFKKSFRSDILDKSIKIDVTTTTLRYIRKYGSFDNYILLSEPRELWSSFGEYLRKIMHMKLKDPELDLSNVPIFGMRKDVSRNYRDLPKFKLHEFIPQNLRHRDLTVYKKKTLNNATRREVQILKAMYTSEEEFEKFKEEFEQKKKEEEDFERKSEETLKPKIEKIEKFMQKKAKISPTYYKLYQIQAEEAENEEFEEYENEGKIFSNMNLLVDEGNKE